MVAVAVKFLPLDEDTDEDHRFYLELFLLNSKGYSSPIALIGEE